MSNNKQSSVEFLEQKFISIFVNDEGFKKAIEQAKAMHKEELEFAFKGGMNLVEGHLWKPIDKFEEFYNETFGGEQ